MATVKKPIIVKKTVTTKRGTPLSKRKQQLKKKVVKSKLYNSKIVKKIRKNKFINKYPKTNLAIGLGLLIGIAMIAILLVFGLYIIIFAPKFETDLLYNKESTIIYDVNGEEFARLGAENRELVTYDELPQVLVDAIIATEDSRFFQHNGFDIARFMKASFGQIAGDSGAGGASTLTMQVVKNTFTSKNSKGLSGIVRKFTDIYMSVFKVERNYTKEEIIEFYVNAPWLGNGTYGVEQACQTFFGKSVKDLTLAEAALMAGLFKAPNTYNPFNHPEAATQRRSTVLALMVKHGYITKEQKDNAEKIAVSSLLADNNGALINKYQGFVDTVVEEVVTKTGNDPYNIPMQIYSTMNPKKQDVLNSLDNGEYYTFVNDVVQTSIAITDIKNGSVTAVLTGRNQTTERSFNRATMMNRHPGSTAKPFFDYGPLIEYNNASTYTPFLDEKTTYSNGQNIKNADGSYEGLITMRQALVKSRNIPALRAFKQLDKEKVKDFVHSLGIDYGADLLESMSIGGFDGISPLTMSAAYAAFARGGYYIEPYSFTKLVYTESGDTFEQKPVSTKVMSEETAYMINSMLVTGGSNGVGGNINVSGTDVAAKGGTSTYDSSYLEKIGVPDSASADNWMEVFSPDYSISVWYGYDQVSKDYYTSSLAGAIARKKITAAVANHVFEKNSRFEKPSGVVSSKVEWETFPPQLPSENTPESLIVTELFKKGTQPTEVSKRFSQLDNPTNGKYTVSGNSVTISWDPIAKPDAVSTSYLQEYFNEYYEDQAQKYYEKRIAYNNTNIGDFGYRVYLKDSSGNLTYLGFTTQSSFTYNGSSNDFVVKSAYGIFTANASTGLTINSSSNPIVEPPTNDYNPIFRDIVPVCVQADTGDYIDTDYVTVIDDTNKNNKVDVGEPIITTNVNIKSTIKYQNNSSPIPAIPLNIVGKYYIKYVITTGENVTKEVLVCQNGCKNNTTCN